eukprot:gene21127-15623_t
MERSSAAQVETPSRPRPTIEMERKASVKFEDKPLTITIESITPQPSPAGATVPAPIPSPLPASQQLSSASPLAKLFGGEPPSSTIEDTSPVPTVDSEASSDLNSPAPGKPVVAQKLEKKLARMSFKKPNFKNLLNDNGLDDQMKQELEVAAEVKQTGAIPTPRTSVVGKAAAAAAEPAQPARTPVPPRQLSISVRPSEPSRSGYLQKLDSSSLAELGEDSWLDQYAALEIANGELKLFAEIGGRRILRGTINANDHIVRSIDYVFYGKVFAFEFVVKNDDGS